jgi:hypothetical protein
VVAGVKPELQTYSSVLTRLVQEKELEEVFKLIEVLLGKSGPRGSPVAVAASLVPVLEAVMQLARNDSNVYGSFQQRTEDAAHRLTRLLSSAGADKADQGRRRQISGKLAQLMRDLRSDDGSVHEEEVNPWGSQMSLYSGLTSGGLWSPNPTIWAPANRKARTIPGDERSRCNFGSPNDSEGDTTLPFATDTESADALATLRSAASTPEGWPPVATV